MSLWLSADELIELTGYRQREPQMTRWAVTAIEAAQHCKSRPDYVLTGPLLQRVRGRFATNGGHS